MNLINCRECGKIFASAGKKICPDCSKSEEEKYELVKDYLWDNPNSRVKTVSDATGVEEKLIIKFIKNNRLQSEGLKIDHTLKCKICDKKIEAGVYCDSCRSKMINDLSSKPSQETEKDKKKGKKSEKMFISDRFKKKER